MEQILKLNFISLGLFIFELTLQVPVSKTYPLPKEKLYSPNQTIVI